MIKPITSKRMMANNYWKLLIDTNGYKEVQGNELATQVRKGRAFELLDNVRLTDSRRIKVRLLEDGYICWLELKNIKEQVVHQRSWKPTLLTESEIQMKLPDILSWIQKASKKNNKYLWGGTLGPDFDCSGLVQTAFAIKGIWLPRDAYQQEKFCRSINFDKNSFKELLPGDLIFFGTLNQCTHVGVYKGESCYWHSSGPDYGRDGIGIDGLQADNENPISAYYRKRLRSIGRIESCHDGSTIS